jgi:hypothetical protein
MARPEDRYRKLKTKKLVDGRVVYSSAIPVSIETDDLDESFVANERDRMDIVAKNQFGSALDWWRIAAANKKVNGSLHFKPGQTVIIPRA